MDLLLSARFAPYEQLQACRNGARMTTGGLERTPGAPLEPHDPEAVAALQQALVDLGFGLGTGGPEVPMRLSPGPARCLERDKMRYSERHAYGSLR